MIRKLSERLMFVGEKINEISEFDFEFYEKHGFNKLNYWVNEFNRINEFVQLTSNSNPLWNDTNDHNFFLERIIINELNDKINLYLSNYELQEKDDLIVIRGELNYGLINDIIEESWPNLILSKHIINKYVRDQSFKRYNIYCGKINDVFTFYLSI